MIGSFVLILSLISRSRYSIAFACLSISLIGFVGGAGANVYVKDRLKGEKDFIATMDAVKAIDDMYPNHRQDIVMMYDSGNFDIPGVALGGIYFDMYSRLIHYKENDAINPAQFFQFNDQKIVWIAEKEDAFEKLTAQLKKYPEYIKFDLIDQRAINSGNKPFHVFLFHFIMNKNPLVHLKVGDAFEFEIPFKGDGFNLPEINNVGKSFIWTGPETKSDLYLNIDPIKNDIKISVCAISVIKSDILDNFKLLVNQTPISLTRSTRPDCWILYTGTVPARAFAQQSSETQFTFEIDRTYSPAELGASLDNRKLGIALDWIKLEP